jgi:hypothetical protein
MGRAKVTLETKDKDKSDETVRGTKLIYSLRTKQARAEFLEQVRIFSKEVSINLRPICVKIPDSWI